MRPFHRNNTVTLMNLFNDKINLILVPKHYGATLVHPLLQFAVENITSGMHVIGRYH